MLKRFKHQLHKPHYLQQSEMYLTVFARKRNNSLDRIYKKRITKNKIQNVLRDVSELLHSLVDRQDYAKPMHIENIYDMTILIKKKIDANIKNNCVIRLDTKGKQK
ncbi:hypothetical protein Glove_236g16 [Diversispora epigaea]|uniref:Uncharacterized protein n=1 Tax=Diversispora epigaea TaxID=1348612 RepID=A0A397IHQ0_9GLOM|nr:hypothetical protein Glove_236g16 [Diversispora epigaea]